jgi:hypothetical protein
MRSKIEVNSVKLTVLAWGAIAGLVTGCSSTLIVHPFQDELVLHPVSATTASAEGVRAANLTPTMRVREHAPKEIRSFDGSVTHGPLFFEDPFEENGSDDGQFAWTGEDYLQWWYWRGRFLVNAILSPWSVVDTPPWTVMVSDGEPSRRVIGHLHDADRYVAPTTNTAAAPAETGG